MLVQVWGVETMSLSERDIELPSKHLPSLSSYFPSKTKYAVFYLILLVNAGKSQEKTLKYFIGVCSLESRYSVADTGEFILFVVIETRLGKPRQYCVHSVVWTTRSKGSSCKHRHFNIGLDYLKRRRIARSQEKAISIAEF